MAETKKAIKKATSMQFGILSEEEIQRMSVVEVKNEMIIDHRTMQPMVNGILDPRMGTTDRDAVCATCSCSTIECPGHFGHIMLSQPVFHISFIDTVYNILRCICCECGMLKLRGKNNSKRNNI